MEVAKAEQSVIFCTNKAKQIKPVRSQRGLGPTHLGPGGILWEAGHCFETPQMCSEDD